jgi:hypothetical protein
LHGNSASLEVLTEKLFTAAAVEASAAKLGVIGNNTITNREALDLRVESGNNTDNLVARDEGEFGNELSLVNVQVSTTDTARLDLDLFSN